MYTEIKSMCIVDLNIKFKAINLHDLRVEKGRGKNIRVGILINQIPKSSSRKNLLYLIILVIIERQHEASENYKLEQTRK